MASMRRKARKFFRKMMCLGCATADAADANPHIRAVHVRNSLHTRRSFRVAAEPVWARPVDFASGEPFEAEGPRRPHILPCGHSVSRQSLETALLQPGRKACPQCGAALPAQTVDGFPVNYTVVDFLRVHHPTPLGPPAQRVPPSASLNVPGCPCTTPRSTCGETGSVTAHSSSVQLPATPPTPPAAAAPWWTPWGILATWWGAGQMSSKGKASPPRHSNGAPKADQSSGAAHTQHCPARGAAQAAQTAEQQRRLSLPPEKPCALDAAEASLGTGGSPARQSERMHEPRMQAEDVLTAVVVGVTILAGVVIVGARLLRR